MKIGKHWIFHPARAERVPTSLLQNWYLSVFRYQNNPLSFWISFLKCLSTTKLFNNCESLNFAYFVQTKKTPYKMETVSIILRHPPKKPEWLWHFRLARATAKTRVDPESLDDFRFRKKNEIGFPQFLWILWHKTWYRVGELWTRNYSIITYQQH